MRSFLGLVNYYYGNFLPHLASTLAPLYSLIQKTKSFHWRPAQDKAFKEAKKLLTSQNLLVHFDATRELVLSCDASPYYGLGAVLSHGAADGTDQPIAFASRTLSKVEQRYAHLDKEELAIVWGVKKFTNICLEDYLL